jgi:hypothetical protein
MPLIVSTDRVFGILKKTFATKSTKNKKHSFAFYAFCGKSSAASANTWAAGKRRPE